MQTARLPKDSSVRLAIAPEQAAPLVFALATLVGVTIVMAFGLLHSRAGHDLAIWIGLA